MGKIEFLQRESLTFFTSLILHQWSDAIQNDTSFSFKFTDEMGERKDICF